MRLILREDTVDTEDWRNDAPKLSDGKTLNWSEIFGTAHPVNNAASDTAYAGMSTAQLYDKFWTPEIFIQTTGLSDFSESIKTNLANVRRLIGKIFMEECRKLGYSIKTNPFIEYLGKVYFGKNGEEKVLTRYQVIHDMLNQKNITAEFLRGIKGSLEATLLYNINLYNLSGSAILKIFTTIKEKANSLPNSIKNTDYQQKFKEFDKYQIFCRILSAGYSLMDDAVDDSAPSQSDAQKALSGGEFLDSSEINNNIVLLFGESKKEKEDAKDAATALDQINLAFGEFIKTKITLPVSPNTTPWGEAPYSNLKKVLCYLALAAIGTDHTNIFNREGVKGKISITDIDKQADFDSLAKAGKNLQNNITPTVLADLIKKF